MRVLEEQALKGRILAIDPGERRVGLAVSDPERRVALGLPTFEASHGHGLIDHLREVLQAYGACLIVLGLPRTLRGESGEAARNSKALARRLRRDLGLEVVLWDEWLTSVQANRLLEGSGAPKAARDQIAATLILQSYLDRLAGEQT